MAVELLLAICFTWVVFGGQDLDPGHWFPLYRTPKAACTQNSMLSVMAMGERKVPIRRDKSLYRQPHWLFHPCCGPLPG